MRQSIGRYLFAAAWLFTVGCDRTSRAHDTNPGTIVSLSPAASDLLVAMGLQKHIVGVSAFEANDALKNLPNLGDYQRIDWEGIASVRPEFLILQGQADRLPSGIFDRCQALGVRPVVLEIDRFADIERSVRELGTALNETPAAERVCASMASSLAALAEPAGIRRKALIVLNERGTAVVGRNNFINDALEAAGGENVITADGYPSLDREKLLTLRPDVTFIIMPGASDALINEARSTLAEACGTTLNVPITGSNALLPGTAMIGLAQKFHTHLRPAAG